MEPCRGEDRDEDPEDGDGGEHGGRGPRGSQGQPGEEDRGGPGEDRQPMSEEDLDHGHRTRDDEEALDAPQLRTRVQPLEHPRRVAEDDDEPGGHDVPLQGDRGEGTHRYRPRNTSSIDVSVPGSGRNRQRAAISVPVPTGELDRDGMSNHLTPLSPSLHDTRPFTTPCVGAGQGGTTPGRRGARRRGTGFPSGTDRSRTRVRGCGPQPAP